MDGKIRDALLLPFIALCALATSGCESLLFRFANRGLPPPEATVTYASDRALALDVYRPTAAASEGAAPVVVFFYGGAWRSGERWHYRFVGRRLARNGVLAIVADYRTFPDARFPGFMDDAARAVAWTHRHAGEHGGDPARLYLAGHSAGAHIAALLATDPRHLAAHHLAPADLAGVVGLAGPYDFEVGTEFRDIFGPPSAWADAQPVNFVDGDEPPFLLVHGTGDRRVEARDSRQMAEALRAAGVPVELLLLPGGGHDAPLWGLYDPVREPTVLPGILDFVRSR